MRLAVLTGNPKNDGLCHSFIQAVTDGAKQAGAEIEKPDIFDFKRCKICGDGWGTCLREHYCQNGGDGFSEVHKTLALVDAFCIITPVYWGECDEALKSFLDRLRRCDSPLVINQYGCFKNKPVLIIATAGGSGNGILSCIEQLSRFCHHMGATVFDFIGVNRWNCDYKKIAAFSAANELIKGRRPGDTILS